ncbi:hypothetical protein CBI38_10750 [Rhodococcus oxybenzonivorans]|uniref:Uncharacterized protein n=1 Tax=Rhodococcus oxybenzonivorans TaxID=1990687 RepID=A0A2S2BTU4_9NOCA|nr:hypothetical protein CBI38_10750 [Rhodococcus oxybenzonivorans]
MLVPDFAHGVERNGDAGRGDKAGPERYLARHVRDAPAQGDRVPPRILTEHRGRATAGAEHRAVSGSWWSCRNRRVPQTVHLAGLHLQIEAVEGKDVTEFLVQCSDGDR